MSPGEVRGGFRSQLGLHAVAPSPQWERPGSAPVHTCSWGALAQAAARHRGGGDPPGVASSQAVFLHFLSKVLSH